jgi:hypothetical protein
MMIKYWCGYTDYNFLPRYLALYGSMLEHCGDFTLFTMAFDDESYTILDKLRHTPIHAIHYSEVITPDLVEIRGTRKFNEWIWSTTPRWIQYLLTERGLDEVYYVDGDCLFYDYPGPLYAECLHQNIAISPHRFPYELLWREKANGKFNVGVEYFKNAPITLECLRRWHSQAVEWCYHDSPGDGRCAEQGYLDDWPEKYGAHIIDHLGIDLAPWNQAQYDYDIDEEGRLLVAGIFPVIIYHFHKWSMERDSDYPLNLYIKGILYAMYKRAVEEAQEYLESLI